MSLPNTALVGDAAVVYGAGRVDPDMLADALELQLQQTPEARPTWRKGQGAWTVTASKGEHAGYLVTAQYVDGLLPVELAPPKRGAKRRWTDEFDQAVLRAWALVSDPSGIGIHTQRTGIPLHDSQAIRVESPSAKGPLRMLGPLVAVRYEGRLGGDSRVKLYEHEFAELDASQRPILAVDGAEQLFVLGGAYSVTPEGIKG